MQRLATAALLAGAVVLAGATTASAIEPSVSGAENYRACLVTALYWEAGSESDESIRKHAEVIAWRTKRDDYPNDLCEVVFQRRQFSAFNDGVRAMRDNNRIKKVHDIADQVLTKWWPDLFGGEACVQQDALTGNCIVRKKDTIVRLLPPGTTHFAVADCYYADQPGYNYERGPGGTCVPGWAKNMEMVSSEPCSLVKSRPCEIGFWRVRLIASNGN